MALDMKAGRPSSNKKEITLSDIKENMVRLSFDVTPELRTKLKLEATAQGSNIKDFTTKIIEEFLSKK